MTSESNSCKCFPICGSLTDYPSELHYGDFLIKAHIFNFILQMRKTQLRMPKDTEVLRSLSPSNSENPDLNYLAATSGLSLNDFQCLSQFSFLLVLFLVKKTC
jgi:hypothetical protein